jgi:aspartyl-tRNA synthetase
MERILISELGKHIGESVRIRGRVDTIRDQGKIVFFIIRDRTSKVQTLIWGGNNKELLEKAKKITHESIVDITGTVNKTEQVVQGYEVEISEITVDSLSETPLPIVMEEEYADNTTALDRRLDYRWIDLRTEKNNLMISVATLVTAKLREYCLKNNFKEIQAPRIINAASEGGANVFEVKYFDKKAYLAQSPQFHKQMAMAADLERVFNVGPVFRAEKSFTTRHLTEYTSFDVEFAYIDSFKDVCEYEQEMIKYMLSAVKEKYGDEIKKVFGIEMKVPKEDFPYISVREAKEKLAEAGIKSKDDGDFSPEEERTISGIMEKETGSEFLFMIDYPHKDRAFYHMKNPKNPKLALGFDLFWKGIEITSGAQREHRVDELVKNAKERGIETKELEDYFDYFRYGCPPHGGFAIGTERLLMKMLGYGSILETTFLPNTPNRLGKLINKN